MRLYIQAFSIKRLIHFSSRATFLDLVDETDLKEYNVIDERWAFWANDKSSQIRIKKC